MKNAPFFARFLENQSPLSREERNALAGGSLAYETSKYQDVDVTDKYPSDSDEVYTEKYPSDDDELSADWE